MLRRCSAAALLVVLLSPASAFAWGFEAHKEITRRAIELLPVELKSFFAAHREEFAQQAIEPDLWRNVFPEEEPNHFVNFGAPELGPFPFLAFPREQDAAIQKFGITSLRRLGTLPWREAEMFGNLQREFVYVSQNSGPAGVYLLEYAGAAAHYLQDATQPLHAYNDYDGQGTNQRGIHARFETQLFERFGSRLTLTPAPAKAFTSPREYAFETLLTSYQKVPALLAADSEAVAGKEFYDDDYFEKFFRKVKPLLEERMSAAIAATASMIITSWEQAGRPVVKDPTRIPERVQKVRR